VRFLVDASLPRAVATLLKQKSHSADDVRDIGLRTASDSHIAEHAKKNDLITLTADFDFADIRAYPPENFSGIVVIERPENASVAQVLEIVNHLLDQTTLHPTLRCRLAIISPSRIRLRPALPG
jgi:predicted nuclease of predicted toxin-antitoxin system